MFDDYRWRTLLILFAASAQGRELRFVDLFDAAGAPHTTGRRIVEELERLGFVAVRAGDYASSRKLVSLTAVGVAQMENYFECRAHSI